MVVRNGCNLLKMLSLRESECPAEATIYNNNVVACMAFIIMTMDIHDDHHQVKIYINLLLIEYNNLKLHSPVLETFIGFALFVYSEGAPVVK
jgi:hypothetical protein